MPKLAAGMMVLALCSGLPGALAVEPPQQPDLRPFLDIQVHSFSTESLSFLDERTTIYQSGALVYQARNGFEEECAHTTLALGPGSAAALRPIRRALRSGDVANQQDCGLGSDFGFYLYQLAWEGLDGRTNDFQFGALYPSGCPAGVALVKEAVEAYLRAVLSDPATKVISNDPCPL